MVFYGERIGTYARDVSEIAPLLNPALGMRAIGRLFGGRNLSVFRWIRIDATSVPEPDISDNSKIVQIDEIHHF